jgi:hypothetical protein
MMLPFLKKRKTPRTQEPMPDRMVGLSGDEELEHKTIEELMKAAKDGDHGLFRSSLEAFLSHQFDWEGEDAE